MGRRDRTATAVCPRCSKQQRVPVAAVAHECERCLWEWRFAICGTCDTLVCILEYLESWQCQSCSTFNRSWWKTADAGRDAMVVAERRRIENVTHPGRRLVAGGGAVALLVASIWLVIPRESPEERAEAAADRACRRFDRLRRDEASGTLAREALLQQVQAVAAEAAAAPGAVRAASARVDGAARSGTDSPAFDAAMTSMEDACRTVLGSAGG